MSAVTTELNQHAMVEKVVVGGDLAALSPAERLHYYKKVCESTGLNPLTRPFEYIRLNNRLTLYAKRDATDQLRKIHGVSIKIVAREKVDELYIVTAQATDKSGRTDESVGAVNLSTLKGEAAANAIMKAETKAKRRVTLSIAGLGLLDETEICSIPDATTVNVDMATGEVLGPTKTEPVKLTNDIKNKVHADTLVCLERGDEMGLQQIWSEFDADEKAVLWGMFNSQQRTAMKKLMAGGP